MTSNSPAHEDDDVANAAWRAALLLAVTSVAVGLTVAFGLWSVFGPSPVRHASRADVPAFRAPAR